MRFSLRTLFLLILITAVLLAVMRLPVFQRLSLAVHLLGFALWNVLAVAALMYLVEATERFISRIRR
jgi:hypothetical protein